MHQEPTPQLLELTTIGGLRSYRGLDGAEHVPRASHELCLGMPGMHGTCAAVTSMRRADLSSHWGAFDDQVTGSSSAFTTTKIVMST